MEYVIDLVMDKWSESGVGGGNGVVSGSRIMRMEFAGLAGTAARTIIIVEY